MTVAVVGTECAVKVGAVAAKVALLWPEATVTPAGTVNMALLLLRATVVALLAAWLRVTVQLVLPWLPRVDPAQETEESWAEPEGSEITPVADEGDMLIELPPAVEATIPLILIEIVVLDGAAAI